MKRLRTTARRAVTLTELLVVLVIISLLASIAVPTYIQKIQQARVTIARVETKEIAEALQTVAIVHGFVVPLRALDNIAGESSADPADDFSDGTFRTSLLIDAYQSADTQRANGQSLTIASNDVRVRSMVTNWQGPFIEYHRVYTPGNIPNPTSLDDADLARDFPLDPWGKPYRLYAPTGVVGTLDVPDNPGETYNTTLPDSIDDGFLSSFESTRFDRWAVLSTGPSGYSDGVIAGTGTGDVIDDVYYTFNITIENETAYSIF